MFIWQNNKLIVYFRCLVNIILLIIKKKDHGSKEEFCA